MFVLRIAGDVFGQKRNIEVTFPRRPSLQQICTVAETILPLQARGDRRPWRPPGPLQGSASVAPYASSLAPPGDSAEVPHGGAQRTATAGNYVVETIVYVNPATRDWEEVYSAAQLSSGSQVYCFCPLQRRRSAVIQPWRSASLDRPRGADTHGRSTLPPIAQVVTEVREHWVNVDRPGGIPEPQQHLVWDPTAISDHIAASVAPWRHGNGDNHNQTLSSWAAADESHHLDRGGDDTALAASPARPVRSASLLTASHSPSALQPSYLLHRSLEGCESGRVRRRGDVDSSGVADHPYRTSGVSKLSFSPSAPRTSSESYPTYFTQSYTAGGGGGGGSRMESFQRAGWRSVERSSSRGGRTSDRCAGDTPAALILNGGQNGLYTNLGERLALLFDVLVHLDAQDTGAERHYVLLRDFYLLSSYVASGPTAAATRGGGSAVPPHPLLLADELAARFQLSWDDVLRSADQDRDGCISYREWVAFGIEHPDIIELLCQAVRRIPSHVSAAMMRLHPQNEARSPAHDAASSAAPADGLRHRSCSSGSAAVRSTASSPPTSFPCRIHSDSGSERVRDSLLTGPLELQDGTASYAGRCEACRALAAQSPEERLRRAWTPPPFVRTLRQC